MWSWFPGMHPQFAAIARSDILVQGYLFLYWIALVEFSFHEFVQLLF